LSLVRARRPTPVRELGSFKVRRCVKCGRIMRIDLRECDCVRCTDLRGGPPETEGPYMGGRSGPYCKECRDGRPTHELPEVAVAVCFLTHRRNHDRLYKVGETLATVADELHEERRLVAVGTPQDDLYFNLRARLEAGIDFGIRAQMSSIFTHMNPRHLIIAHNPVRKLKGRPRERFKYTLETHLDELETVIVLEDVTTNPDFRSVYEELAKEHPDTFRFLTTKDVDEIVETLRG